jgi:hypothetical protein
MEAFGRFNSIYMRVINVQQLKVIIVVSFNIVSLKIWVISADSGSLPSNNITL